MVPGTICIVISNNPYLYLWWFDLSVVVDSIWAMYGVGSCVSKFSGGVNKVALFDEVANHCRWQAIQTERF